MTWTPPEAPPSNDCSFSLALGSRAAQDRQLASQICSRLTLNFDGSPYLPDYIVQHSERVQQARDGTIHSGRPRYEHDFEGPSKAKDVLVVQAAHRPPREKTHSLMFLTRAEKVLFLQEVTLLLWHPKPTAFLRRRNLF